MEEMQKLENLAKENLNLAHYEKDLSKAALEASKLEINRAKARES